MEAALKMIASHVALGAELVCVLCVALGAAVAVLRTGKALATGQTSQTAVRRDIWRGFAGWIILALEFALAADIVRTAIAPTWADIGQLAAIAVIRTGLNSFLERDLETLGRSRKAD